MVEYWNIGKIGLDLRPVDREMLEEAGFRESHVYWENEDEDDKNYGKWQRGDDAPSNPSWICYLVALK